MDPQVIVLVAITLFAAIMNGALGYGFSSLTVPVALLFYSNRVLNPTLVLVEVVVNTYNLMINWKSVPLIWKRVLPIVYGLVPGVIAGSYVVFLVHPAWLKFSTYAVLLPLILAQAAGVRRPIRSERAIGVPFGAGVGVLYSVTTISGPPLALMLSNQGFVKQDFRAALCLVRVVESTLTATAYHFLGMYSGANTQLLSVIVPSIVLGIPAGAFIIRRLNAETFRRVCMSFDAWVVGFGLSRVLIELSLITSLGAYGVWLSVASIDMCLLYTYFRARRVPQTDAGRWAVQTSTPSRIPATGE